MTHASYPVISIGSSVSTISFDTDGTVLPVSEDTVTPSLSNPLPVKLFGTVGPIVLTAEEINVQLSHDGLTPDSTQIGDGTYLLGITIDNEAKTQPNGHSVDNEADLGNPLKVGGKYNLALPTYDNGDRANLQMDINGRAIVRDKVLHAQDIASNSADIGNPVKVGGVYNLIPPVFDTGDRADLQLNVNGALISAATISSQVVANTPDTENPIKIGGKHTTVLPTFDNGDKADLHLDVNGRAWTRDKILSAQDVVDNAADVGNAVKIGGVYKSSLQSYDNGDRVDLLTDANGRLVTKSVAYSLVLDNAVDIENPIKVGGRYNLALPTYDNGDKADLQLDVNGRLITTIKTKTILDQFDETLWDSSLDVPHNIPQVGANAVQVVTALSANVSKIHIVEDIGEYMALYSIADRSVLLCVLPLGGGELELEIPAGTAIFLGSLTTSDIVEGKMAINFIG